MIVAAVVVAAVVIYDKASTALSAGSGTATITWVPTPGNAPGVIFPPRTFVGTIGGKKLVGHAAVKVVTVGHSTLILGSPPSSTVVISDYDGSLGGKPFAIVQSDRPNSTDPAQNDPLLYGGTFDGMRVNLMLGAAPGLSLTAAVVHHSGATRSPIHFFGTIGTWRVTGLIDFPTWTGDEQTATATYRVSP